MIGTVNAITASRVEKAGNVRAGRATIAPRSAPAPPVRPRFFLGSAPPGTAAEPEGVGQSAWELGVPVAGATARRCRVAGPSTARCQSARLGRRVSFRERIRGGFGAMRGGPVGVGGSDFRLGGCATGQASPWVWA